MAADVTKGSQIEEAIRASLVNGKLPCPVAFKISRDLNVSTKVIGDTANKLDIKISNCQLGCFP
jgi:hypothetical protein